jgi:hypothetical protein
MRGRSGVPMVDGEQERKKQVPIATVKRPVPRLVASALLEESGEVAPIDLGRFGKRAGQIIAHGTSARHDETGGKGMHGRRPPRRYGAV